MSLIINISALITFTHATVCVASSLSPPKFFLRCFFTPHPQFFCDGVLWCDSYVYCICTSDTQVSTVELGDVLQILGSQAVVERVSSRTLIVWPHHWVAGWRVSKAQCMSKLMKEHCEEISAFGGWEERQREEGNAELFRRCRGLQFLQWGTVMGGNVWFGLKPCS